LEDAITDDELDCNLRRITIVLYDSPLEIFWNKPHTLFVVFYGRHEASIDNRNDSSDSKVDSGKEC
jgi:hypothetical protein